MIFISSRKNSLQAVILIAIITVTRSYAIQEYSINDNDTAQEITVERSDLENKDLIRTIELSATRVLDEEDFDEFIIARADANNSTNINGSDITNATLSNTTTIEPLTTLIDNSTTTTMTNSTDPESTTIDPDIQNSTTNQANSTSTLQSTTQQSNLNDDVLNQSEFESFKVTMIIISVFTGLTFLALLSTMIYLVVTKTVITRF